MTATSPLRGQPAANGAKRGKNASAQVRTLDHFSGPGSFGNAPSTTAIHIAANDGGKGTPGRKTYPKLPN